MAPAEGIDPSHRGFGDRMAGHSSPIYWLAAPDSNRAHSRLTAGRARLECSLPSRIGAERRSRTKLHWFGRPAQFPNCKPRDWCRPSGSNGDPSLFRGVHEPSLLSRRWLRRADLNRRSQGYEPCEDNRAPLPRIRIGTGGHARNGTDALMRGVLFLLSYAGYWSGCW